ncbi:hypothetical protein DIPPA_27526 [Diplonema papillatum]|nr:hypothetical protein DIPPA_27526 [Diplonema papillatum]
MEGALRELLQKVERGAAQRVRVEARTGAEAWLAVACIAGFGDEMHKRAGAHLSVGVEYDGSFAPEKQLRADGHAALLRSDPLIITATRQTLFANHRQHRVSMDELASSRTLKHTSLFLQEHCASGDLVVCDVRPDCALHFLFASFVAKLLLTESTAEVLEIIPSLAGTEADPTLTVTLRFSGAQLLV